MDSFCDNPMTESPKVWTELKANGPEVSADEERQTIQSMATDSISHVEGEVAHEDLYGRVTPRLHCLESGDATDYSVMAVLQSDGSKRPYCPSIESRELHNHKERLRRSRMKCSCDALRALVPGLTDKTDKATVLEHTVAFLFHLSKCSGVKCDDYLPTYPPPMSAKLLELYPTLMSGEYQYYEAIPSADPDFNTNETHVVEVRETNGTQYVITSDGSQYMVVDNNANADQTMAAIDEQTAPTHRSEQADDNMSDTNTEPMTEAMFDEPIITPKEEQMEETVDECNRCVAQVVDMLTDNKENIDPNAVDSAKPIRKKRAYRKRKDREATASKAPTVADTDSPPKVALKARRQRRVKQNS